MKNSKKCDFKKLALLGIAGGTILGTQAVADSNNASQLLAFNGCGGEHGCHGAGSMGGNNKGGNYYQAYRNTPSQDSNYYSNQGSSNGCQSAQMPQGQWQQSQPSNGCQSAQMSQGQWQPSQPSHGCQGAQMSQGQWQPSQSQGCQGAQMSQGQNNYQQQRQMQGQSNYMQGQNQQGQMQQSPSAANQRGTYTQWETDGNTADNAKSNTMSTQRAMTESELLSQLNDQGKATYQGLDASGKALALKLANQDCKGHNECKGMNSCKTEDHACAGKGSCAGTANSNFKDKNLAVKVAALKMSEKRANAASSKY